MLSRNPSPDVSVTAESSRRFKMVDLNAIYCACHFLGLASKEQAFRATGQLALGHVAGERCPATMIGSVL